VQGVVGAVRMFHSLGEDMHAREIVLDALASE
jgi:hypothetical protein